MGNWSAATPSVLFTSEPAATLACFRIVLGIFLLIEARLLCYDWETLYGVNSVIPECSFATWPNTPGVSGFPRTVPRLLLHLAARRPSAAYWAHVIAVCAMIAGIETRLSVFAVLVTFRILLERNPLAVGGPESTYRCFLFLLLVSPSGAAYSLDTLLASGSLNSTAVVPGWSVELLRWQVSWVIFNTALSKIRGRGWWTGEAMHVLLTMASTARERVPGGLGTSIPFPRRLRKPLVFRTLARGTLAIQIVGPLLLWVPCTRPYALSVLIAHHMGMQVFLSVGLYQPLMILGLLLFADITPLLAARPSQ